MQNQITLTPTAQKHLRDNLARSPEGTLGVRLGLRDAGCSGFAYTLDLVTEHSVEDLTLDFDDVKIIIPANNISALNGSEIDFIREGLNYVLKVNNPNVIHACGCGESFQIKENNS